jgi:hypothetical protein
MAIFFILLGIVAVAIGIVVVAGKYESRTDKKVADTADWLETEATIQDAVVERLDKYTSYPSFAFSYAVHGEYFSGRFFLKANSEQSDELIKILLHRKFPVQYDPDNLSVSYIAEATIEGYEIIQKLGCDYPSDTGPYRSDGDEPIDLHLNG